MKDPKDLPPDFSDLRRRAEERLEAETISAEALSPAEATRLIHELQVHQIELELQNEELRQAQVQLAESRDKYADLYDFAPVGYLTLDKVGKILEANLTAATMLGLERSKLLDRYFPLFLMETDRRVFRQLLSNSLNQPEQRGELHLQDGNGGVRTLLLDILFLQDAEGRERRRIALTDITELKGTQEEMQLHKEDLEKVNEQLREANDNLRALFEAAPLGLGVFDAEGKVVSVNPANEHIFGWSKEEFEGRLPLSIPKEPAEDSLTLLQRILQGESFTGAEIKQQRKDGALIDISLSAAPLLDREGRIRGFIGLAEDITERKQAEEALRTQARVLESMAEAVTVTDSQGHIQYTNPAFDAMFGYKPGELLGRHSNILNFYPPEEKTRIVKDILRQVHNAGAWFGEFHNRKKNGQPFFTSARISAIEVGGKKLFISVQEDISERKRSEELLRRQAELLDLAHDAIVVRDPQGRIIYWNQGATNHYGWPKEVALKKNIHKLLKTAFPQPLPEIERLLLEQGYWEGELAHTTLHGQRLVMNSRWTVKRDDGGRVVAILEINQDVTAQKQIEKEIHRLASYPLLNPNPVLEADENGKVTYANPAARQVAEKLGLDGGVQAFLPPDLKKLFARARKGGPRQHSFDLILKDLVYAVTLSFPHDLPTVRLYAMDITERKRAEEALSQSQAEFEAIFHSISDGVIFADPERRIVMVNPAAENLFGYSQKEMQDRDTGFLYESSEDYREQGRRRYHASPDQPQPVYEITYRRKDGSVFPAESRGSQVKDAQGRVIGFVSIHRDITERKVTEEALRESREDLNRAQAVAQIGSWRMDVRRNELTWSDENHRIFGIPKGTPLTYESFLAIVHPEDREFVDQKWMGSLQGEAYDIEHRIVVNGQVKWVRERAELEVDDHGQLSGGFGTTQDITERRRAEEVLREREAKLSSILATAPVGIGLVLDRVFVEVNQRICQMTGYTPMELLGKSSRFLYPLQEEFDYVGLEKYRQIEEQGLGTVETRWQRKDGEIIEVLLSSSLMVPGDPASGVTFTALDITKRKRTEEALQESEERYRSLFENNHAVMLLIDPETGDILDANPAACGYYGFSREELLAQKISDLNILTPEEVFQEMQRAKARERKYFEFRHRLASGEIRDVEVFSGPIRIKGQDLLYSIVHDNTARKQAEAALRESEAQFRSLFEHMTEGVALHEVIFDDQGRAADYRIVATNPAYTIHTGLNTEQVQGQVASQAYGTGEAPYLETFAQVAELGQPVSFETFFPPLQRHFSISVTSPKPGHFVTVFADITKRKEAEEALRQSEARYRAIGELIPYGVWICGADGGIEYLSPSFLKMTGKTLEECRDYGWMDLLPQEDIKTTLAAWQYCLETGGFWDYEHNIRSKDGYYHTVLSRGVPLADSQGRITSWVGLNLDISERKEMEEALRRAHDELEERVAERTAALRLANEQLLWEIEERRETEDRLRESEARFTAFMKHLPGLAVMRDVQGHYVFANETWERLMGKTRDDWQGKSLEELWPREMARKYQQLDQQVLLAGEPVEALDTLEMVDGLHHLLSYRFPIRDMDGLPFMVGAIGIDVTARQRAEEALAAERQRLFSLLENLPAFIYLQDRDYTVRFANRQFRERFGEPEGRTCFSLLWGRDLPCPECPTFKVFQSGEPYDWEWQAPDGRIYQIYDYPFADVDGTPLVMEMGIDITARKQAEEEALHQTRLFEAFFDYAITPLVFLDPQFNFIRVNQAYARACHREVSDFAGRNHFDLYPSDAKLIFEEVVRNKMPYAAMARPFEFPDHPEWGITYWDWSLVPILDEAGEVDFLVYSLNDVTEQVLAEEERRRLVEILENTTDFVGIADFYGNLLYLNRAGRALVGVGQEEDVRQLKVLELHPDRFGELILQEGAPTARREGSWQAEIALRHRDGREIPVSQVVLAHKDATGRVQFFSTIARDISDLKQAQENILRQAKTLNGINRIFREALTSETEEELGRTCLAVAEELTDSRFGFIDELSEQGTFDALAFSDPGWDLCNMPDIIEPKHLKNIKPVGLLAKSVREGKTLLVNDPASHPDAVGIPPGHPPLIAYLGVPLISGERTIGLIGLGNKPGGYSRNDQGTVETLAPSIVEALMHHQARKDLRRSESKLRHLADQLLTAQENERKRLAAELHDELGHALLTLKLALSSIAKELLPGQENIKEDIREQLAYINDVIGEVRRLYHDLSPGDVEDLGLTKALKTMIEDFAIHQPHINWEVDLPALEGLFSQPVQTIIYRLVQEGLTNIGKHANPEHVNISAVNEGSQVRFVIRDDGAGFDMVEVLESASGLGLVAMEERLNMVGGSFEIWSRKGGGTRISFSIPTLPEDER